MIDATEPVFPNNAVALIKIALQTIDADLRIYGRPLRSSDPAQSIGVFPQLWQPDEQSYEMRGGPEGPSEPTLSRYQIAVQGFIKDLDEERGLATHSVLSKQIRTTLYRNSPLMVALRMLAVTMNGSTERTQRCGVMTARYLSNEIDGNFLYLSTLDFFLETETV